MKKRIEYVNHRGEYIAFDSVGKWHYAATDVHDASWDYASENERILYFTKRMREFTLEVSMRTSGNGLYERNRAADVFDADVVAKKPGRLYVGDSYIDCYCIESKKSGWHFDEDVMKAKLTFLCERPFWTRRSLFEFIKRDSAAFEGGFDYPHGFGGIDYAADEGGAYSLRNPYSNPSDLHLIFYGPAHNPAVTIGGNSYGVFCDVPDGGLLVLDTRDKTVWLYDREGNPANRFSARFDGIRGSGRYAFEKVQPGMNRVSWDERSFGFGGWLYDERSEPAWT